MGLALKKAILLKWLHIKLRQPAGGCAWACGRLPAPSGAMGRVRRNGCRQIGEPMPGGDARGAGSDRALRPSGD